MKKTTATAAALLACCAMAMAQDAGITLKGEPEEILAEASQISGAAIAGAMIVGGATQETPRLSARIPHEWAGSDICVALVSDDGRYEAARNYSVPANWPGGHADIPYPTKYKAFLGATTAETLGVTVQQGTCTERGGDYALAGWNTDIGAESETAKLLLNTFRADEAYLIAHDTDEEIACAELLSDKRTAFDFACTLPERLIYGEGPVTLEVNRIRDGQIETARVIDIFRTTRGR